MMIITVPSWIKVLTVSMMHIPYIGNHPRKNKFADFAKFGSFANVFLLLFSVC